MSNTRRAPWAALALVALLAACSSSGSSKASDTTNKPASGETTTAAASSSGGAKKIDACSLLADADAVAILGEPVDKKGPASGVGESVCEWHTATENSITISVGSPGTAPNDKLTLDPILGTPEPVPALNGKGFYLSGGEVDFAAGNRYNSVQVVTAANGGDRTQAADLAVKIAPKIAEAS